MVPLSYHGCGIQGFYKRKNTESEVSEVDYFEADKHPESSNQNPGEKHIP